jgi:glycosyltransferase involved in cell wall biosynthesis
LKRAVNQRVPHPLATHLKTAVIVPAFNEAGRITNVLKTIAAARLVDELIVVTDGCTDSTADEAQGFAARLEKGTVATAKDGKGITCRVLELEQNVGKGGAMTYGAHRTEADIILFLDADLIGLTSEQVDSMLTPLLLADPGQRVDMSMGLFGSAHGGLFGWWLSLNHRCFSYITGQRAIRREVYLAIPGLSNARFGVETAITRYVKHIWKLRWVNVTLDGVSHPCKEEKIGLLRGFKHRSGMYSEMAAYIITDVYRQSSSLERRRKTLEMRQYFSNRS